MNRLEKHLRTAGRKLLIPYVTGGLTDDWTTYVRAYADAGADAIEIGLPFSDPMIDGPTVQEASDRALARGTTVPTLLNDLAHLDTAVPLIAMTYTNLIAPTTSADLATAEGSFGGAATCADLAAAGIAGVIVPDLPLEESPALETAADRAGLDLILLAAPSTPPERRAEIAARSRGFVYAVTLMGTTGARDTFPESAAALATDLRARTDLPVVLGIGLSRPEHAAMAGRYADGVVVGSALVRRILDGDPPAAVGARVAALRRALDHP